MAFRPPRQPPKFADLKTILAQTKDVEGPLYQVVQEIIERLSSFNFEVPTEIIKKDGSETGNPVVDATYLTVDNETADLPNSRQLLYRYGLKSDDTIPDRRIVDLDLEYFGNFAAGPLYSDGDVVVGSDNIAYLCVRPTNAPPVPWPGTGIPSPPPANDATYWTATPSAGLTNERALSLLANGYVKSTLGEPSTVGIIPLSDGGTGNSLVIAPTGNVLMSNGSNVIFNNGLGIAQLNASSLSTGTVNDARLSANVPLKNANNAYTGQNDFQGYAVFSNPTPQFLPTIVNPSPLLNFYESDQPTDKHYTRIMIQDNTFFFQGNNDNYNSPTTFASISAFGMVLGTIGENTIFANGSGLTNLNASRLATGIVPPERLGSGVPSVSTFLRGDSQWVAIPSGIPSGLIALFETACPLGWTRFSALDGRFPRGAASSGATGGSIVHQHSLSGNTGTAGSHSHTATLALSGASFSVTVFGRTQSSSGSFFSYGGGSNNRETIGTHDHGVSIDLVNVPVTGNATGSTSAVSDHVHALSGLTTVAGDYPPFMDMVYCRKD